MRTMTETSENFGKTVYFEQLVSVYNLDGHALPNCMISVLHKSKSKAQVEAVRSAINCVKDVLLSIADGMILITIILNGKVSEAIAKRDLKRSNHLAWFDIAKVFQNLRKRRPLNEQSETQIQEALLVCGILDQTSSRGDKYNCNRLETFQSLKAVTVLFRDTKEGKSRENIKH